MSSTPKVRQSVLATPLFGDKPLPLKTIEEMLCGRRAINKDPNDVVTWVDQNAYRKLTEHVPHLGMSVKYVQYGQDKAWERAIRIHVKVKGSDDLVLEEPAEMFPSDGLIAQLLLISP